MLLYDMIATLLTPTLWWGRVRVEGLDQVPDTGPLLIVPNHDSQMDPVIVGLAIRPKRRLRYLSRADLWRVPGLGPVLDAMQQLPVKRGSGDSAALDRAVDALNTGHAVAVFPEGRLSWGVPVRARTGIGVLAVRCPSARVLLCSIEGTTDYVRWPKRPRVTVRFLLPEGGQVRPGEEPAPLAQRLLRELRERVPVVAAGRQAIVGGPPRIRRYLEREGLTAGIEVKPPEPLSDVTPDT